MSATFLKIFFSIMCFNFYFLTVKAGSLKFCTNSKKSARVNEGIKRACNELQKKTSDMSCVIANDRLACLRMLYSGLADFTVLEPEDLSVTSMHIVDQINVLVTHELKMFSETRPQFDVEMIAIVKNNLDNTWITRGKKLCYIGLEVGSKTNYHYHYTSYFERWLVNKGCDKNKTLLENRITDLSRHFDSACIAGPWSLDPIYDLTLKSKYKNLCSLCGSPAGCYEGDRYYGIQGALNCLLENVGEVAWVTKTSALRYFTELAPYGFSLLCPDGMFIPLSVNKTCTWIAEPRPTLVARSDVADKVSKRINDLENFGKDFYQVIHSSYKFSHLANLTPILTPEEYMSRFQGYLSAKGHVTCEAERAVRWCVVANIEANKCGWMQAAAIALNIEPEISCIQQQDRKAAIDAVQDDRCDLFISKPEEDIYARKMNLTPIAHLVSNQNLEASRFAAVVRKDSKLKSLKDLKGKKACFAGYKSVGWNSFFSTIRKNASSLPCDDEQAISEFFDESCVYGLSEKNSSTPSNLYSLCGKAKLEPNSNAEENTFRCLMNAGDVAFVNITAAKNYYSRFSIFHMNYKMLCQEEDNSSEEPCYLAETTLGSIVSRENLSPMKKKEIYLLLLSLDRYFGRNYDRESAMFSLYGLYDGHSDVIFNDRTEYVQKRMGNPRQGLTYEEVLESLREPVRCGLSNGSFANASLALVILLAFVTWLSN